MLPENRRRTPPPQAIPRAGGAVCEVENPGYANLPIPRAGGAVCEAENPGYAGLGDDGLAILLLDDERNHQRLASWPSVEMVERRRVGVRLELGG